MILDQYLNPILQIHNGIAIHEEISHRNIWDMPWTGIDNHLMLFSFSLFRGENFEHFIYTKRSDRGSPKRVIE